MPAVPVHHTATVDESWDGPAAEAAMPNDSATLTYCHAWYSADGNRDDKSTYKFPHAKRKGGPANLSACRNGLARLPDASIPDGDRAGVKAHLQAHLDDAKKAGAGPVNTKSLTGLRVKDADQGTITAVFSTLNQIDSDGDVTLPGAFAEGAPVVISSYGHTSWSGVLPVGKGTIHTVGDQAILDGQFFMDVPEARSTFMVLKAMGDQQEFSYGYDPTEFSYGEQDGQKVRFLKQVKVFEVSPVLRGAGVGTRLLAAKAADAVTEPPQTTVEQPTPTSSPSPAPERKMAAITPHRSPISDDQWDAAKSIGEIPAAARPSDLRSVFAWFDPDADPELKSSYRLGHHDSINGPANTRALVMGIAELNTPEGQAMPADARKAAYEHLAAHLRDAEMDPLELRSGPVLAMKFVEHGAAVLAAVTGFNARAQEVMALRAEKGKRLSPASAELIGWIDEELTRTKELLTAPQLVMEDRLRDEEYSTLAAALAAVHGN